MIWFRQLKCQTSAFLHGFRSVINPRWLRSFSPSEVQRLISGDNVRLNIDDLKANVEYIGGCGWLEVVSFSVVFAYIVLRCSYFSGHRVIKWLWQIVGKEMTMEEQSKFLKFVTSCSKPPVLGFSALHVCGISFFLPFHAVLMFCMVAKIYHSRRNGGVRCSFVFAWKRVGQLFSTR